MFIDFRIGVMKKPPPRPQLPPRLSNNDKRKLLQAPDAALIQTLAAQAHYVGSSKHKQWPHLFGLPPFNGRRGDATLCDAHAGFTPAQMATVAQLIQRGITAGLVGHCGLIWTVADNGWIFEARLTNPQQAEYHGYPVRDSEPIAECVYRRFAAWAEQNGSTAHNHAAAMCRDLYGFK